MVMRCQPLFSEMITHDPFSSISWECMRMQNKNTKNSKQYTDQHPLQNATRAVKKKKKKLESFSTDFCIQEITALLLAARRDKHTEDTCQNPLLPNQAAKPPAAVRLMTWLQIITPPSSSSSPQPSAHTQKEDEWRSVLKCSDMKSRVHFTSGYSVSDLTVGENFTAYRDGLARRFTYFSMTPFIWNNETKFF